MEDLENAINAISENQEIMMVEKEQEDIATTDKDENKVDKDISKGRDITYISTYINLPCKL